MGQTGKESELKSIFSNNLRSEAPASRNERVKTLDNVIVKKSVVQFDSVESDQFVHLEEQRVEKLEQDR